MKFVILNNRQASAAAREIVNLIFDRGAVLTSVAIRQKTEQLICAECANKVECGREPRAECVKELSGLTATAEKCTRRGGYRGGAK